MVNTRKDDQISFENVIQFDRNIIIFHKIFADKCINKNNIYGGYYLVFFYYMYDVHDQNSTSLVWSRYSPPR